MNRTRNQKAARRWLALFLAVLLAMGSIPFALASTYPYTSTTNDKVNMRRSAYSTSVVLDRLEAGTEVTVLGESGAYYKVSYDNRTGYILKQYVGDQAAPTATAKTTTSSAGTVSGYPYQTTTRDAVNMRKSPSSSSVILERLPVGAEITVAGDSGDYLKVSYNGTNGYVMAEFVYVRTIATAPTPVPAASVNTAYETLSSGDTGKAVKALQQALMELGFLTGTADGKFGAQTESGLNAFQEKNGLTQTGVADAMLQTLIYEGKPLNARGRKTTVKTLPPLAGATISDGNTGDAVIDLQKRLTELGYYTGSISGEYDAKTKSALKAFQKKNSLKSDGVAGSATQDALYSDSALGKDASDAASTPTPAPSAAAPGITVRQGDEGDAVKAVQKRLKELGYLNGSVDGKFGTASVQALTDFQKRNGLTQDGVAGAGTQRVLFSNSALAAASITPVPTATPLTQDNAIEIRRGTRGAAVLSLQKRLTELGYYTAKMDSDYEAADIAAVKAFQKANGLKADGIAGYETQVILYSAWAVPGPNASPTPTPTVPAALSTLKQGDSGNEVKSLQQRLIQLNYLSGTADGQFGSNTALAVSAFQKANGLKQDGVAGASTLSKLYSASAAPAPSPTPSPTPSFLQQGDSSDAVKEMQQTLIDLGYLNGKADGVFGAATFLALKAFQSNNGLSADGVAGSRTLDKLFGSTAKPAPTVPGATATPKPTAPVVDASPKASQVRYANWYTEIRARCRTYPYATVYDFNTGLSWKVHMFSLGAHADSEPMTAADTAVMVQAFGGKYTWTPKPVWVIMSDGRVYMASTHDNPHEVDHNQSNNFPGHLCIHFPRTQAEVTAIGPYATSHQATIDLGWEQTQKLIN